MIPASSIEDALSPAQRAVLERVVAEEEARRAHLVVYLSGAHAYGFPSPDSDLDLKAIHCAGTLDIAGLHPPPPTFDRAEIVDGVEIDYTSNELGHVLAGILGGNGNFIERVLGRLSAHASPLLDELRPIVERTLSRRVHKHYRGFAGQQLAALEREPTTKKLLYVLRTALTGIHLLETAELEPDLTRLADRYGLADAHELVVRKRGGERIGVDPALLAAWRPRLAELFTKLDAARERSALPEAPSNDEEVATWLRSVRRARL